MLKSHDTEIELDSNVDTPLQDKFIILSLEFGVDKDNQNCGICFLRNKK